MSSRGQNEHKFKLWKELEHGGRLYWRDVRGRTFGHARYFKEVDREENTLRFWQEIYDDNGTLVELHYKFPVDEGHHKL